MAQISLRPEHALDVIKASVVLMCHKTAPELCWVSVENCVISKVVPSTDGSYSTRILSIIQVKKAGANQSAAAEQLTR